MLGNPIITSKGLALLAKVTTNTLTLSNMGIGDGEKSISESVDSLANEILKKPIEYVQLQGNVINARTTFTNENLQTGFYIKELGIYAIDPDEGEILYAYTSVDGTDADYFSPGIGTIILREFIELVIGFGNASKVELTIDPTSVFITANEFQRLESEVEKKAYKTDIPTTLPANGGNADTVDGLHATDFFETEIKVEIPNYDLNDLVDTGFYVIQPTGAVNPTVNKPFDGWGTCIHIKHESTFHQMALYTSGDAKPKTYRRSFINTTWTEWSDLDDADTLDGISRTDFLQHYRQGAGIDITTSTYTQLYYADINEEQAQSIGLEVSWWHLLYLPHGPHGYGMQIAFSLNSSDVYRPKYRTSNGSTWQSWRYLNDNIYVQSTAPTNPQTNDLWIW